MNCKICNSKKWDRRFLDMAKLVSSWSKDPSTKVGAVITDDENRIISVGYNGFPREVIDNESRLNDRELKYQVIIHAEMNAIMFANKSLKGCTLYTYPFEPCSKCASVIIQSGIKRVVSYPNCKDRWESSFEISRKLFQESGVELSYAT
jgi:dCMP deaminase